MLLGNVLRIDGISHPVSHSHSHAPTRPNPTDRTQHDPPPTRPDPRRYDDTLAWATVPSGALVVQVRNTLTLAVSPQWDDVRALYFVADLPPASTLRKTPLVNSPKALLSSINGACDMRCGVVWCGVGGVGWCGGYFV